LARSARLALSLTLIAASLSLALATAASASRWQYRAGSAPVPRALTLAAAGATRADRLLVAEAHALRQCLSAHPRRCAAQHAAVQSAGRWLASAERQMAKLARATAQAATASRRYGAVVRNPRQAPRLYVLGRRLVWSRVARVGKYVFKRAVPGQGEQYLLIDGQSFTPPVVPGTAVAYSVRTAVRGSTWSGERAIDYPPATTPSGTPNPGADPDKRAAPAIAVSGQALSWHSVAGVGTYVLATYVAGRVPSYSEVSGTSVTPPAVPGSNVRYSVRTAVNGSAWAEEVSISYPAPAPPPPVTPPPAPGGGEPRSSMIVSLDTGGWSWASAVNDAAGAVKHFRASFKYYNSDSQMELLAKAGVQLMPLFGAGGTLAEYNNPAFFNEIVTWFKRYGHGGSFWAGKPVDLGATTCELINEPGNPYFYPDAGNYQLYADMTKAVHSALETDFAPAVRPELLVSYDGGFSGSSYGRALFAAGAVADAVTVHPYGGHGSGSELGNRERVTQAHAETGLPVYVTEIGWPTALGMQPTGDSLQWSEQRQAENITNFMSWARSLGYVADVTYFNYADYGPNDYYGIVNSTGSVHKLSYQALRTAAAAG
jgi:hypothetical protein